MESRASQACGRELAGMLSGLPIPVEGALTPRSGARTSGRAGPSTGPLIGGSRPMTVPSRIGRRRLQRLETGNPNWFLRWSATRRSPEPPGPQAHVPSRRCASPARSCGTESPHVRAAVRSPSAWVSPTRTTDATTRCDRCPAPRTGSWHLVSCGRHSSARMTEAPRLRVTRCAARTGVSSRPGSPELRGCCCARPGRALVRRRVRRGTRRANTAVMLEAAGCESQRSGRASGANHSAAIRGVGGPAPPALQERQVLRAPPEQGTAPPGALIGPERVHLATDRRRLRQGSVSRAGERGIRCRVQLRPSESR
jgi:hypothetical protein